MTRFTDEVFDPVEHAIVVMIILHRLAGHIVERPVGQVRTGECKRVDQYIEQESPFRFHMASRVVSRVDPRDAARVDDAEVAAAGTSEGIDILQHP